MTILYFIIALGVLVFVHELGHFLMAKKQGIGVEKFSLGFGPKIFGFTRGETTYLISALPFGGYVKLMGEDPDATEGSEVPPEKSYSRRPIRQRAAVVFAGPAMNLLLSLVLMPVIFMIGRMEPAYLDQKPVVIGVRHGSVGERIGLKKGDEILKIGDTSPATWKEVLNEVILSGNKDVDLTFRRGDQIVTKRVIIAESPETHAGTLGIEPNFFIGNEPVIDEVSPESPAREAGMQPGDEIIRIDGEPIETWTDMSEKVGASAGKKLEVLIRRGQETLTLSLVPRYDEGAKRWLLGVKKETGKRGDAFVFKRYGFGEALVHGFRENLKLSKLTMTVLGRLVTLQLSYKTLGGPIRIAQASAMAARSGLPDFLYFIAFLSLQLGILNLLPVPVLDGGHLVFFGIEAVRRKPISARVRQAAEQTGFFLLISLMLIVTLNDVESVWGFRQIIDKIRHIF